MSQTNAAKDTLDKVSSELMDELTKELGSGKDEAKSKIEATRRETREIVARITESADKQADTVTRQLIGAAELESRNLVITTIEHTINQVFAEALAQVPKMGVERYERSLRILVNEGVGVIGKEAKIACNSNDKSLVSSLISELNKTGSKLKLEADSIDTVGGIALKSPDDSVRFDNTFEARLERLRPMLRKQVAAMLTGEKR
jgi:V/A-type H+-transporting ATPase subunit E